MICILFLILGLNICKNRKKESIIHLFTFKVFKFGKGGSGGNFNVGTFKPKDEDKDEGEGWGGTNVGGAIPPRDSGNSGGRVGTLGGFKRGIDGWVNVGIFDKGVGLFYARRRSAKSPCF